ncbi:sirohydrochlorin chelatase [Rhodococcoides fascians A25f]|uniref:sirohydrochlorin chelatase n=1 Tax=Rhodococcoides fascians TaxID=1828 RepID=UPI00056AF4B0|nr:sirohydrochlorin chelatase [Rhodococcus fascians]QII06755.1 sirohydrochlorin chelatase [Rhodococcus fascians A25f]
MTPTPVLVAHGTRNPRGVEMIAALADAVSTQIGTTRVAFVDVLGPSPAEVLRGTPGSAVVVPAFLASGYHVHTDVPREIAESAHSSVAVTRALGPDPVLAKVMLDRLRDTGWCTGDSIVLAAAGSSDPRALAEHVRAAAMLAEVAGVPVRIGYVATAVPTVSEAVSALREEGHARIFVASYLLARGLFHNRLADAGADGVGEPLGVHPAIVDLVVARYFEGVRSLESGSFSTATEGWSPVRRR